MFPTNHPTDLIWKKLGIHLWRIFILSEVGSLCQATSLKTKISSQVLFRHFFTVNQWYGFLTMGTLTNKRLSLVNPLTLLRHLFWEVTSVIQEQYSQVTTVTHFFRTGRHKQSEKFAVEKRCSHKYVFTNTPLILVSKLLRNIF